LNAPRSLIDGMQMAAEAIDLQTLRRLVSAGFAQRWTR
jgi:hypothetical protein